MKSYTISAKKEVEKVILYGSDAAGRRDLFTIIDLSIVMDTGQDFLQWTTQLYKELQTNVDLDLLVYTPAELERNRKHGFIRHLLEHGWVIFEK